MPNYQHIAQDLAEESFGPMAQVRPSYVAGRLIVSVSQPTDDGGEEVIALSGDPDATTAWRTILQMLAREDRTLTTAEVAQALGVNDSRIRQLVLEGRLTPTTPGAMGGQSARFSPAAIHAYLQLPRRRGMREALTDANQ